jgi:hypothetical protein
MERTKLIYVTVGLLSFAVILVELLQTRILSFIFWNHIVYLATSIALLGFGMSGTIVATNKFADWNTEQLISKFFIALGISLAGGYLGTVLLPLISIGSSPIKIAICYSLYVLPFVCAGAILSVLFAKARSGVGKLYATDLVCAGLACICFFYLLPLLGATKLLASVIVIAGILSFLWTRPSDKKLRLLGVGVIELGAAMMILPIDQVLPLLPEPYKEYTKEMTTPGARVEKTVWTPLCRIDVIGNAQNIGHGTQGIIQPKDYKILTQDATAYTRIMSGRAIDQAAELQKQGKSDHLSTLPYSIKPNAKVAIIGLGGGDDVVRAINNNAKSIYGAELNPITYRFLVQDYSDYRNHYFDRQNIHLVNEEGRSMMRGLHDKVDLLIINGIDTFAAQSSGAYMLSENYLYTVEAIHDFFEKIEDDGILGETRWSGTETLRLASLIGKSLKDDGSKTLTKQIFVILDPYGWASVIAKKQPFTADEVKTILKLAKNSGCQILYLPKVFSGSEAATVEAEYMSAPSPAIAASRKDYDAMLTAYDANTETKFFADYPLLITPTNDDAPFFFEYGRRGMFGLPEMNKLRGSAMSALLIAIAQATVCTLVAIFLPLWKFSRDGASVPAAVELSTYFASLGFAFMLIELGLMQKCVLFLGNPLYSLSVVLATLLLSAGAGSAMVNWLKWDLKKVTIIFGSAFVVVAICLIFLLSSSIYRLMTLSLPLRMLCTFAMLFPIGMTMGTFFPSGLQFVRERSERYLPWAWGINGCSSVYGSFAAIFMAIYYGFTATLLVGVAVYVIGFVAAVSAYRKLKASEAQ